MEDESNGTCTEFVGVGWRAQPSKFEVSHSTSAKPTLHLPVSLNPGARFSLCSLLCVYVYFDTTNRLLIRTPISARVSTLDLNL